MASRKSREGISLHLTPCTLRPALDASRLCSVASRFNLQFLFSKRSHGGHFFYIPSGDVLEHLLDFMPHASKKRCYGQPARASAVAQSTSNAGRHHVSHPDKMKDHRIRRHPDTALSVCPSEKLVAVVLKNSCFENTLLAVTDGAGHHAVVASDTRGELIEES